ncbi:hypothetical protein D5071_03520 [Pectobacterium carotovorum]|uniref:Uncharacterized protein n=1 Tax=Pectobacterium carotovorum TaxID=554 RepID=A0A419B095_PECCA|nr:hypothetical protein D5071_03520 [Pectobacterium carotovorum]
MPLILRALSQYIPFQTVLHMPSAQELQTAISNMSIWRKGDQRAPLSPTPGKYTSVINRPPT